MHRGEIERLIGKTAEKGLTLVPTRIYFKGPRAKVELGLATGKEGRDRSREIARPRRQARGRARLQAAAQLAAALGRFRTARTRPGGGNAECAPKKPACDYSSR